MSATSRTSRTPLAELLALCGPPAVGDLARRAAQAEAVARGELKFDKATRRYELAVAGKREG